MSFSSDVRNGFFFSMLSNASLNRAEENISNSLELIISPYYDLTSNMKAILHPIFHATQLFVDACNFVYGAVVLLASLASGHFSAARSTAFGMLELLGAAVLEILNIALSIVSLLTRFVASIFNFGYISTSIQLRGACLNGREIGGRNEETIHNLLFATALSSVNSNAKKNDEHHHESAFTLI